MQIGLFFGSFNPVHIGHMAIANYMLTFTDMEEVWLVVSPHNPLKQKSRRGAPGVPFFLLGGVRGSAKSFASKQICTS